MKGNGLELKDLGALPVTPSIYCLAGIAPKPRGIGYNPKPTSYWGFQFGLRATGSKLGIANLGFVLVNLKHPVRREGRNGGLGPHSPSFSNIGFGGSQN